MADITHIHTCKCGVGWWCKRQACPLTRFVHHEAHVKEIARKEQRGVPFDEGAPEGGETVLDEDEAAKLERELDELF